MVGFTSYGIVFSNILVGIRIRRIFEESNDKNIWYMIGAYYRQIPLIIICTVDFWIVDISRKYT